MAQLDDDDHRKLAQRFDLFHFQEEAPGHGVLAPEGAADCTGCSSMRCARSSTRTAIAR